MSPQLVFIAVLLLVMQLFVPKKWAFVPILIAACHTSNVPVVSDFTTIRIVILAGLLRAILKNNLNFSLRNFFDRIILLFCLFILISAVGHDPKWGNPYMFRLGFVLNILGTYLYFKSFLLNIDDWKTFQIALAYILLPLAGMMLYEYATQTNPYRVLGARQDFALVRGGDVRAQGPFGGPILAGTAGAVSLPLIIPLFFHRKNLAMAGLIACVSIIFVSSSSGPIGTLFVALASLFLWKHRLKLRVIAYSLVIFLFLIELATTRPVWHLIARIDFTGGSTGWHRSALIDAAIAHIGDWWLIGTDITRHWMPYALHSVPNHSDLTNYFIHIGVIAGILPVILLSLAIYKCLYFFANQSIVCENSESRFTYWTIWSALFAQLVTFLTISYYDQMFVFFYVLFSFASNLQASQPQPNLTPLKLSS